VHKEAASKVGFSNYRDASLGFDVLGKEFCEDDLLSEKL
jgi:hypothetical protein